MMLSPAHVLPACAKIDNGAARFTFHRISKPIEGAMPHFRYPAQWRRQ